LREEAEDSKKIKEQFLANMSHEIRTPMNAIKGMTELLSEKTHDDESLRYIHAISQSSNNLLVILNDILDLSKIQAGKFFIQRVAFSLKEQVMLMYDTLLVLANEKGIDLILNYDLIIPNYLEGDPVRINQVLYNLVNNALEFTDTGSVHIDIKSEKLIAENDSDKKNVS
jgi:signal transduction histidine kinase